MAVKGLDHINISTADLAGTTEFFTQVLGLEVGWRPDLPFAGAWLYADGKDLVHLAEVSEKPRPSRGSALDHFAFAIDDYDDAVRRLDRLGVQYRPLSPPGTSIQQLFIVDLNGVTIELNCRA